MKLVIQRTVKEVTEEPEYKMIPVLDEDGKDTGKKERQYTGKTKQVETGDEVLEQKEIPLIDYKQNKDAIIKAGWEVVAEANIIDLSEQKFFQPKEKKAQY